MDKAEAGRILKLSENATKRQIDKRFENLSRRIKNGENLDAEKIEQAYNFLNNYEKYVDHSGKFALAFRRFMFNYKGWVILIVFSVFIMSLVLVPIVFRRIPDLTISFAGRYGIRDQKIMDAVLQEKMPDVEDVLVEVMYLDEDGKSGDFDAGGRTRLMGLLISEEADIFIVDDKIYNFLRNDDTLMPLENVLDKLGIEIPKDMLVHGIDFETGKKMVFGIITKDNFLIDKTVYGEKQRIITIAKTTGHIDEVIRAVEIMLSYRSE